MGGRALVWRNQRDFIASGAPCGTVHPHGPEFDAVEAEFDWLKQAAWMEAVPDAEIDPATVLAPVVIDVYVHVITDRRGAGNVSDSQVAAQIDVLNHAFAGLDGPGGAASPFTFRLAGLDRTANSAWYTMANGSAEELAAKTALRQGGPEALNLYTAKPKDRLLEWTLFCAPVAP
jgi:hypothetical protein